MVKYAFGFPGFAMVSHILVKCCLAVNYFTHKEQAFSCYSRVALWSVNLALIIPLVVLLLIYSALPLSASGIGEEEKERYFILFFSFSCF